MKHRAFSPRTAGVVLVILLLQACTAPDTAFPETTLDDLDLSSFAQIPSVAEIDSGAVPLSLQPAAEYDHWQLCRFEQRDVVVLAQGGSRDQADLPPQVSCYMETTPLQAGFGASCAPAWCFDYIWAADREGVKTLLSIDQLRSFLGDIDTRDEAALLAEASGYRWGTSKETAAIREVAAGYQVLVLKYVQRSGVSQLGQLPRPAARSAFCRSDGG
jgi:hypothetical protein